MIPIAALAIIGAVAIPLLIAGLGLAAHFIRRLERGEGPGAAGTARLGRSHGDAAVLEEFRKLQEQMAELRQTTTRYDVSFDTALQRIEDRMSTVEQRVQAIEGEKQARIGST